MADDASGDGAEALTLSDDEFKSIVAEQRRMSVGFGFANDSDLADERELALNYFKGEMPDAASPENRSQAVSMDVAEAVETVTPDLVEILAGGDDVVTLIPHGPEDETACEQETEYLRQEFLQRNPGILILTTAIKDGLLTKLGVVKWWWEETREPYAREVEGLNAVQLQQAQAMASANGAEIVDVAEAGADPDGLPLYRATVKGETVEGKSCIAAVPGDDFTVAKDTVRLADAAYCAMRSRVRVQDLIAQGYDEDIVSELPPYTGSGGGNRDETQQQARDTAGEHQSGTESPSAHPGLKIVEVVEHYVRLDADGDGKPELWKVVTGGGETVFVAKEKVSRLPFACWTPYLVAHRLYGRSLSDMLAEIQRIRTSLLRMLLDSGYFALNQRMEVATERASEWTVSDLLRNEPGSPIRSKSGDAVRPIQAGSLAFDVQGALEFAAVMGEQRSGVKRHSMGLNPETLHQTASGALGQLDEAMKRVRFMARLAAETMMRDMFLGLHDLIRANASGAQKRRLGGSWADVDPSQWPARSQVQIELGIGSGGKAWKLQGLNMIAGLIEKAVALQQGFNGPFVDAQGIARFLEKFPQELGFKTPFFATASDVAQRLQAQAANPQQPAPDPKLLIAQAQNQTEQQRLQLDARKQQLAEAQFQAEQQAAQAKAQADEAFRWAQLKQEAELAIANIQAEYKTTIDAAQIKAEAEQLRAGADMAIQAQKHTHGIVEAAHEAQHAADAMAQEHAHEHASAVRDAMLAPPPEPPPQIDGDPEAMG